MNWGSIAETLGDEYRRLFPGLPTFAGLCAPGETSVEAFLRLEQSTMERVEYAVRCFAQKRQWPELTPAERTMLSFRVEFAAYLANFLAEQPRPWTDVDDPTFFEERVVWSMLFAWSHGGFDQAINTLDYATTGSCRNRPNIDVNRTRFLPVHAPALINRNPLESCLPPARRPLLGR